VQFARFAFLHLDKDEHSCYNGSYRRAGRFSGTARKEHCHMLGAILTFIIALLATALVLWIVSRFNLGISVESFTSAIIAGLVIGIIAGIVSWLLGLLGISLGQGGLLSWIVSIIVAALVLMFGASFLPGLKVNGFGGAIIAAIAIGVVGWLVQWVLGLFGINVSADPTEPVTLILRLLA
jgi:putative membrane protein